MLATSSLGWVVSGVHLLSLLHDDAHVVQDRAPEGQGAAAYALYQLGLGGEGSLRAAIADAALDPLARLLQVCRRTPVWDDDTDTAMHSGSSCKHVLPRLSASWRMWPSGDVQSQPSQQLASPSWPAPACWSTRPQAKACRVRTQISVVKIKSSAVQVSQWVYLHLQPHRTLPDQPVLPRDHCLAEIL